MPFYHKVVFLVAILRIIEAGSLRTDQSPANDFLDYLDNPKKRRLEVTGNCPTASITNQCVSETQDMNLYVPIGNVGDILNFNLLDYSIVENYFRPLPNFYLSLGQVQQDT